MGKQYRLTLVDDNTHEKIHSIRFNRLGFFISLAAVILVMVGGLYAAIAFTPLRQTIPGYPEAHFRAKAIRNAIIIDSLESSMTRWALYAANVNRVLQGGKSLEPDSLIKGGGLHYLSSEQEEYLRQRDSVLREMVAREEQFGVSGGERRELPVEGIHFFTPVKGVISNGFDVALHPAVDVTAPANTVVKAVLDGTVIYAGWSDEFGFTIQIQHTGDLVSTYKHNDKLLRKVGDKVNAGTPVAQLGNAGSLTTGYHLHFELWYKGEPLDPTKYINF